MLFTAPKAPSLEIRTVLDESKVLLAGYNFSVVCTTNSSKEYDEFTREDEKPFIITMFYGVDLVKWCGSEELKEDTMTCTLLISNATLESSGNYSCMARNEMMCTIATILVIVEGIWPIFFMFCFCCVSYLCQFRCQSSIDFKKDDKRNEIHFTTRLFLFVSFNSWNLSIAWQKYNFTSLKKNS